MKVTKYPRAEGREERAGEGWRSRVGFLWERTKSLGHVEALRNSPYQVEKYGKIETYSTSHLSDASVPLPRGVVYLRVDEMAGAHPQEEARSGEVHVGDFPYMLPSSNLFS